MRRFLSFLTLVLALHHHAKRTRSATVFKPRNCTFVFLRFTGGERTDEVFEIKEALFGEALHRRLDVLLAEHRDASLDTTLHVSVYDRDGRGFEEAIRLDVV